MSPETLLEYFDGLGKEHPLLRTAPIWTAFEEAARAWDRLTKCETVSQQDADALFERILTARCGFSAWPALWRGAHDWARDRGFRVPPVGRNGLP
jgi:hypothetical protein